MRSRPETQTAGIDAFQMEILENLIARKTFYPPGNEEEAARYLAGVLEPLGFTTRLQEVRPGRSNLVARFRGGAGPEIGFSGHLDVVAADAGQWTGDPFRLRQKDGRLYGRGVCDMKGAISSMVAAARDFLAGREFFAGTLTLLFVVDEEVNALGSRHFTADGGRPDAVIIGEPTGLNVHVAHRGVMRYHLDITGRSGHAARPGQSLNPIGVAAEVIRRVDARNAALATVRHPVLPPPTMAVTMIEAGEQPNVIPGRCRLTVDRRTMPGEGEAALCAELDAIRGDLPPEFADAVGRPEFFVAVRASEQLPDSTLAEECRALLAGMGVPAVIEAFPVGCDQFVFIEAGVDCLLVGPGNIANAHCADEYVDIAELAQARDFYRMFMEARLGPGA